VFHYITSHAIELCASIENSKRAASQHMYSAEERAVHLSSYFVSVSCILNHAFSGEKLYIT
jgi:hypothetical protein